MNRDPRNPDERYMVAGGSTHPSHQSFRKTLVLLKIQDIGAPLYFVVEGLSRWPLPIEELLGQSQYFYEEHTCPTNFIRIPLISLGGDHDPHGVFNFVDAVWMMDEYEAAQERGDLTDYLTEVFPQLVKDIKP